MQNLELLHPKDLNRSEWRQLQTLQRVGFGEQLPHRTQEEIDTLVSWGDPERFYTSHINPNSEVGEGEDKRFNPDQTFYSPWVTVAVDGQDFVGFAYAANNVSGASKLERIAKMIGTSRRYFWLREAVVHPDYQRHGVAIDMLSSLATKSHAQQPDSTYIWPDEIPHIMPILQKRGFEPKGEELVPIFGQDKLPVRQVRMQRGPQ